MTFNIIMLAYSTFFTGYGLASGHWVTFWINLVCGIYWTICLIYNQRKKKTETTVTVSDETKETLSNLGIKVVVNGKEIN